MVKGEAGWPTEVGRCEGWTQGAQRVKGNWRPVSSIRVSSPRLPVTASVDDHCSLTGPASSLMNSTTDLWSRPLDSAWGQARGRGVGVVKPHGCVVWLSLSLRKLTQSFSLLGRCFNMSSLECLREALVQNAFDSARTRWHQLLFLSIRPPNPCLMYLGKRLQFSIVVPLQSLWMF